MNHSQLAGLMERLATLPKPEFIPASPAFVAAIDAQIKFGDRDRRRVKREINKAVRRARKSHG